MNQRMICDLEESDSESASYGPLLANRTHRSAKSAAGNEPSRRRRFSGGRRKHPTIGGIHLRRNKRTNR